MKDLQMNRPDSVVDGYDGHVCANSSGTMEKALEGTALFLPVTPNVARALLALLVGVHRKRERKHQPKGET